ncbi:MAG TPA: GNAT family N-acetyltransferase [Lacunisphaera sp.]|nr:GNAT family N-acetyltransferase [Lacunisphaera sp.]
MAEPFSFRPYDERDREACFRIFDANCPAFFAPSERADLAEFLAVPPAGYEVAVDDTGVVGAFGVRRESGGLHLRWIMIAPAAQGRGLGRAMVARALSAVRAEGGNALHIATSHQSEAFFARFGAIEVRRTPDGWGPGMHRVDLVLPVA